MGAPGQWATLPSPQTINGIDYDVQVNFCGVHVCNGTLARDRELDGIPCRGRSVVVFSEKTGRLTGCALAHPVSKDGAIWPAGTIVDLTSDWGNRYVLPEAAAPVRVTGMLVHSGLIVQFAREGGIFEIERNVTQRDPDTRLELGGIVLQLGADNYHFGKDGQIDGGVLARAAVVDGKQMNAGDPVVIRAGQAL